MNPNLKKFLNALGLFLLLAVSGGIALFLFVLFALMTAFVPLYVVIGVTIIGIAMILRTFLLSCGYLPERMEHIVKRITLCVLALSILYMGHGFWRDSIPTLDDRKNLLWSYRPLAEDSIAGTLDREASLRFTLDERLRLDGATALYPVYAAFVQAVYPEEPDKYGYTPYSSIVQCSGTIHAYDSLIAGETDMIFAAAPSEGQLLSAKDNGMQLHLTPIGREAFVFFVNSRNPVENLTVEQIQGIYTGDITNWKQVGGKRQSIRPFQRAENSGSQSALLRLMDGLPLMEPEEEDRIAGMGGIIRQVASYRNYKNAIGFSFRFYSTEMVKNDDIRLLALNGIPPTRETIRDGSYPIASEFYAVTAAPIGAPDPRETDPRIDAFLNWIVSEEGQKLVEETGYVAAY